MVVLTEVTERFAEAAGCDSLFLVTDRDSGLHAYIALHDHRHGPGYGGIRRRVFASAHEAVKEVVGLAEAMTLKTAFAGLAAGGAKCVILDPAGDAPVDVDALYLALGTAIEQLDGAFFAGPDVGTSENQLAVLRRATRWVSTIEANPARSTAIGVVAGCRAALAHLGIDPAGRVAAVVGVGSVGSEVARGLHRLGMRLVVSDIDPARASKVAAELGATIAPHDILPDADLLVPCALGAVVTEANVATFRCKIICGSANHQLETTTLAHDLAAHDVLYVPDFAVNAGAVIEGVMRRRGASPSDDAALAAEVEAAVLKTGERTMHMLTRAVEMGITPLESALLMIDEGDSG